jgi:hypothetical protein
MGAMKRALGALCVLAAVVAAAPAVAQTGSLEFVARITPASGRSEPVRQLPFYLLRKSFAACQTEAEQSEPVLDLNRFVEALPVSKELKAWMKRTHSAELSGEDFLSHVTSDDIFKVPEFFDAWLARNAGDTSVGFPSRKYRDQDKERNPEKYAKQKKEYFAALRKFLDSNPQTRDGLDIELTPINAGPRWEQELAARRRRVHDKGLELAQGLYLAATAETDLGGRGAFTGLAPGTYWLSTLEIEGEVGDVRERWDTPVEIRAGQTARLELSNLNAVPRRRPAK